MTKTSTVCGFDVDAAMPNRGNGGQDSIRSIIQCNAQLGADRDKRDYKTAVAQRRAYYRNAIDTLWESFGISKADATKLVKALYKKEYDAAKRANTPSKADAADSAGFAAPNAISQAEFERVLFGLDVSCSHDIPGTCDFC